MSEIYSALRKPLADLATEVAEQAQLYEPDFMCTEGSVSSLSFVALDLDDETSLSGEAVALRIEARNYLFTEWSRRQLLSHVGASEKWFRVVSLQEQAGELTRRLHTFHNHRFRKMRTHEEGIFMVRGLVSAAYAEIADTEVMASLCAVMPEGFCYRRWSGLSDRSFYVYAATQQQTLRLPPAFKGYPGMIVKNSEVGANSLWVIPFLAVDDGTAVRPVILREKALLRRVHRGNCADLKGSLAEALDKLKNLWGPLQKKLEGLTELVFPDEQTAVAKLESALLGLKASKRFTLACTQAYASAHHVRHNGATLLQAVLDACSARQYDEVYDDAEIAGALLFRLL